MINNGLTAGINVAGERMVRHVMYMAEVLLSATVMRVALDMLKPLFATRGADLDPKIVLRTVKRDIHDIGKT